MNLTCCDRSVRRGLLEQGGPANGIDYVEVKYENPPKVQIHLFNSNSCAFSVSNFEVRETRRGSLVTIVSVQANTSSFSFDLSMNIGAIDDFLQEGRTYRVSIKDDNEPDGVPDGFDPRFCDIEFTYNKEVGSEIDFLPKESSPESIFPAPSINYLAKDYASFRQVVLDRLAITMPNWQETHAADLGMTLVELLAFVADRISYEQDAVATESYLATARRRTSVRRHARLVDYRMHEGCNARAFVHLQVAGDLSVAPQDILFTPELPRRFQLPAGVLSYSQIPEESWDSIIAFEPIAAPLGDWRLNKGQIKDPVALRSTFEELPTRISRKALDVPMNLDGTPCPTAPLAPPSGRGAVGEGLDVLATLVDLRLPEISVDNVDKVNTWLETIDLLEEANIFEILRLRYDSLLREIWHLPVAQRNRAILDEFFKDAISAAPLSSKIVLYQSHNEIQFYTWDESECWIRKGATKATLQDYIESPKAPCPPVAPSSSDEASKLERILKLKVGDWLALEEVKGPKTDNPADADRSHRQIVRLTTVLAAFDPIGNRPIVEIEWGREDALRFPLCISSKMSAPECRDVCDVSVARGNLVLVDHGRTADRVRIGIQYGEWKQTDCGSVWYPPKVEAFAKSLEPTLPDEDLTYAQPLLNLSSARLALDQAPEKAIPEVSLLAIPSADGESPVRLSPEVLESNDGKALEQAWRNLQPNERYTLEDLLEPSDAFDLSRQSRGNLFPNDPSQRQERLRQLLFLLRNQVTWTPRFDLMGSGPYCRNFVVENEDTRRATLRFGDNEHGLQPPLGTEFFATYRIGNGSRGNVGAEMIRRVIFRRNASDLIREVRNPLPAQGGTNPETIEQAKLLAPHSYLKDQPRALRADDYRSLVMAKFPGKVQSAHASLSAGATFQWADIAIDPFSTVTDTDALCLEIETYLNSVRKIGHLVTVNLQVRVPVDLRMVVVIDPRYPVQTVRQGIMQRLSNEPLPDGSLGFFHPDRLTFGQSIHSNQIIQETLKVPGVLDPRVTFLGRLGTSTSATPSDPLAWAEHVLSLGPLEIAELDNAGGVNSGRFCLTLEGGR